MGSLISWVVILTTLGNIFDMQVSVAIIETPILFNIVKSIHDDTVKKWCLYICFQGQ